MSAKTLTPDAEEYNIEHALEVQHKNVKIEKSDCKIGNVIKALSESYIEADEKLEKLANHCLGK